MKYGADVNAEDNRYDTPEDYLNSGHNNQKSEINKLLKSAEPEKEAKKILAGLSPEQIKLNNDFVSASSNANEGKMLELLNKGADVNAKDGKGKTALHFAAEMGKLGLVETLLNKRADVNMKNSFGATPLHSACYAVRGTKEIAATLVEYGADVNAKDNYNATPGNSLDDGRNNQKSEINKLLKSAEPEKEAKKILAGLSPGRGKG